MGAGPFEMTREEWIAWTEDQQRRYDEYQQRKAANAVPDLQRLYNTKEDGDADDRI